MENIAPVQDHFVQAAWFVYGDGDRFSKAAATVVRDDALSEMNTEKGRIGFFFVLVGKEVSESQVKAVEDLAHTVAKYMNGTSDESGVGEGNRHSILSRVYPVCRKNALHVMIGNDDLPEAFRSPDGKNRRLLAQNENVPFLQV